MGAEVFVCKRMQHRTFEALGVGFRWKELDVWGFPRAAIFSDVCDSAPGLMLVLGGFGCQAFQDWSGCDYGIWEF